MQPHPQMPRARARLARPFQGASWAGAVSLGLLLLTPPAGAATGSPSAATAPNSPAPAASQAAGKPKAASTKGATTAGGSTGQGTDCTAGAGTKVPSLPKCPGDVKPKTPSSP